MISFLLSAALTLGSWTLSDPFTAPIVVLYEESVPCENYSYAIHCLDLNSCPVPQCPEKSIISFQSESDFRDWLKTRKCSEKIRVFGAKLPACRTVITQVQMPPVPVESAEWEEK